MQKTSLSTSRNGNGHSNMNKSCQKGEAFPKQSFESSADVRRIRLTVPGGRVSDELAGRVLMGGRATESWRCFRCLCVCVHILIKEKH